MTIASHPKGWKVTVDVGRDPITNARRRASRVVEGSKRDARDAEAELRLEYRGKLPATRARTVDDMLAKWLTHIEPDLSPKTVVEYRRHIDNYLSPELGQLPIRSLTAERIEALYRRLRRQGKSGRPLSPNSIKRLHATLSGACKYGVRHKWLRENPAVLADSGRATRYDIEPPTIAEILAVMGEASDDLVDAIVLAAATGARRGEVCGVQWADVDFERGSVTFRRAVVQIGDEAVVVEDRRKSKLRTVAVDQETIDTLRARRVRAAGLALACGVTLSDNGYVLAEEPGQAAPLSPGLISQRWRTAAERAGIPARLHDLRHWHFTELLAAGVNVANLRSRAGWTTDAMVTRYTHAVTKVDREAADIIGARRKRNA